MFTASTQSMVKNSMYRCAAGER